MIAHDLNWGQRIILAAAGAIVLSLSMGCASMFTAKTKATWTEPNGKSITYESDKEQIGLDATFDPKTGFFHIKVDKARTQEQVIAAVLQTQAQILGLLDKLAARIPAK